MNVDYNKHNIVKYLANNKDKDIWKMSVSSIGFQSTKFLDSYPPKGHPFGYTFNPERGRILDEFSLIYITKGRGTFQSGNCSEKKITKGDVFLLFPREWHTYRPAKDIGWNEYFVTFQGEYFNKLLNKIFQPNDPIIHIGINEQMKVSEKAAFFFCYAARLLSIFIFKISLVFSIITFREVILQK